MGKTFIAMENPASWLGDKSQNTARPKPKPTTKHEREKERERLERKTREYEERQKFFKDRDISLYSKATEDDIRVVTVYQQKHSDTTVLAIAGSLPSMVKRLRDHAAATGDRFDTLVFVGHGDEAEMSVGMGTLPPASTSKGQKFEERMGRAKREITLTNTGEWRPAFESVKDLIETWRDGYLHVFLIGCSTGEGKTGVVKGVTAYLTRHVAIELNDVFKVPVAVYGTSNEIEASHTQEILNNLDTIRGNRQTYTMQGGVDLICETKD